MVNMSERGIPSKWVCVWVSLCVLASRFKGVGGGLMAGWGFIMGIYNRETIIGFFS